MQSVHQRSLWPTVLVFLHPAAYYLILTPLHRHCLTHISSVGPLLKVFSLKQIVTHQIINSIIEDFYTRKAHTIVQPAQCQYASKKLSQQCTQKRSTVIQWNGKNRLTFSKQLLTYHPCRQLKNWSICNHCSHGWFIRSIKTARTFLQFKEDCQCFSWQIIEH